MEHRDILLALRLKIGDRDAFAEVVRRHYASVYRQQLGLCGETELAADLTQETFLEAWRSLRSLRELARMRRWIGTIAIRVWQRRGRAERHGEVPIDELAETLPDPAPGPAVETQRRQDASELITAIQRLSTGQRDAITLVYLYGMKYREAAEALSIPTGTVQSRVHAGLEALRGLLDSEEIVG